MDNEVDPRGGSGGRGNDSPLSRSEAVRRALAAGFEEAAEGVSYIGKEFGIEISPSLFLAAKATERKKGWARNGKPGRKPKKSAAEGGVTPAAGRRDEESDDLSD